AEDGIRDKLVTGVQTCALPICEEQHRAGAALDRLELGGHGWPSSLPRSAAGASSSFAAWLRCSASRYAMVCQRSRVSISPAYEEIGRASCRERGERGVWGE